MRLKISCSTLMACCKAKKREKKKKRNQSLLQLKTARCQGGKKICRCFTRFVPMRLCCVSAWGLWQINCWKYLEGHLTQVIAYLSTHGEGMLRTFLFLSCQRGSLIRCSVWNAVLGALSLSCRPTAVTAGHFTLSIYQGLFLSHDAGCPQLSSCSMIGLVRLDFTWWNIFLQLVVILMLAHKLCCYHNCVQTINQAKCLRNPGNLSSCQWIGIYLAPEADFLSWT